VLPEKSGAENSTISGAAEVPDSAKVKKSRRQGK
jgi:hypothetical protein